MLTGTLWWKLDGSDKLSFNLASDKIVMTGLNKEGLLEPPAVVHSTTDSTPTKLSITVTCGTIGSVFWHLVSEGGPMVSATSIVDDAKTFIETKQ